MRGKVMDRVKRRLAVTGCLLGLFLGGCSRQDTECLASLGRKLVEKAQLTATRVGDKLELGWARDGAQEKRGPGESCVECVEQRLRADKFLAGTRIEVLGNEKELQLRGTTKTPLQRQRAIEQAETTPGVKKVSAELLRVVEP
jgi:osmotically-inducible protein OsmY